MLLQALLPACTDSKPAYPSVIGTESVADLKNRFGCLDAFDLVRTSGTFKALVFKLPKASEADSDYRVVFYKKVGNAFVRHGPESNLVNFERPTLVAGAEPTLVTTQRGLGVRFSYSLTGEGAALVPLATGEDGSLGKPPAGAP